VREAAMQTGLFSPKKRRARFFGAPAGAFLFFFTLYIQNSIQQWVNGTPLTYFYLPHHQRLASILRKTAS
jgi:hypothetical protein